MAVPQAMLDFTERVKKEAEGRWDIVAGRLLPEVIQALEKPGKMVFCPFHQSDRKGSKKFRVKADFARTGMLFCTCFNGGNGANHVLNQYLAARKVTFPEAISNVAKVIMGMDPVEFRRTALTPSRIAALKQEEEAESASLIQSIKRIWSETLPFDAPEAMCARLYLRRRWVGTLGQPLVQVRFHPRLKRTQSDGSVDYLPAMVALIRRPDGTVSTLHRMWVTSDGRKAPGDEPRKMYPVPPSHPVMGGAIRLDEPVGLVLNLCEGFETAMSVRAITKQPTWSCVSAAGLAAVVVPPHVRVVTVWADKDRSKQGETSAGILVKRLRDEGRKAMMFLPPFPIPDGAKSVDWNDAMADFARTQAAIWAVRNSRPLDEALEHLNAQQPALGLDALSDHFAVRQWRAAQAACIQALTQSPLKRSA